MTEHHEQVALFEWAARQSNMTPELKLLHAIPNGGHRHKAVAANMKREGVKAGVPDVFLPVARYGFHGLYIEMKFGKNAPTRSQQWWIDQLATENYKVLVCWGFDAARREIERYLGI